MKSQVQASLFVTCLIDQLYPEVGVSVVRILRRLGVDVDFPRDQTCCGQPLFNSGFSKEARSLARRVLQSFGNGSTALEGDAPYVVVPSGSCAAMMRIFYPQLLREDPHLSSQAENLSGRIYEFSEFLVKVLGITNVGAAFQAPNDGKVTYHPSCHLLRELEVSQEPRELIANVKGAQLVEMERAETCCGFGGTFAVKYPAISGAMLADKVDDLVKTGAGTVASCDMSCLMHIGGALSRRGIPVEPVHLAQLLERQLPT